MSKERGLLLTCDRCGATLFLKELNAQEKNADGGYIRWNEYEYEEAPEGWSYQYFGDIRTNGYNLCPKCSKKLAEAHEKFFKNEEKKDDC